MEKEIKNTYSAKLGKNGWTLPYFTVGENTWDMVIGDIWTNERTGSTFEYLGGDNNLNMDILLIEGDDPEIKLGDNILLRASRGINKSIEKRIKEKTI
jgi:hypothetical protein